MKTEIYFFSGTGNSMKVARDLAGKTGAKLIPIPSIIGREIIKPDADTVGLVFPVYFRAVLDGIPLLIRRFAGVFRR